MKNKKSTKFSIVNKLINNILININFNSDLFYFNFLNLIREHDIFFKRYSQLFIDNRFNTLKFIFIKVISFLIITTINLIFSYKKNNFKLVKNTNTLIISHLLNIKDLEKDRYFGNLEKYLKNNKLNATRLLFNNHSKKINHTPSNVILINRHGGLILELKVICKQIILFLKYLKNIKIIKGKKNKCLLNFYKLFLLEILSNECRNNIRFSEIMKKILEHDNLKFIFCTLEGHNWEKIAFLYSKKNNIKINTLGYTASLIFRDQKIINEDNIFAIPDTVLTNCLNNKKLIEKYTDIKKIVNIGNLNNQYNIFKKKNIVIKNNNKLNCLVLPENIVSEFFIFTDLIQNYLNQFNNLCFNVKLHPGMLNNKRINKFINKNKIENLIFTKDETMSHILNSDYVLYRGSNAILFALNLNKTIIYYDKPNEFYLNPLHEDRNKIKSIANIFDLNKITLNKKNANYDFKHNYLEDLKTEEINKILN